MTSLSYIENAAIHGKAGTWDIRINNKKIEHIAQHVPDAHTTIPSSERLNAHGGLVSRSFVEPHFHPDKSFSLSMMPSGIHQDDLANLDGFARAALLKSKFTADDVATRAKRAFELAALNGVTKFRATADVDTIAGLRGLEGLLRAREQVSTLMDIEIVAFPQEGISRDPGTEDLLREALRMGADLVGGWPNVEATAELERAHIDTVFALADEFNVDLDLHLDCFLNPEEKMLEHVAKEIIRRGGKHRVLASHCCALEIYPDSEAARVVRSVAEAGIDVVIVPSNLAGKGPRGLSRPQELLAAGVTVAAGSDNMNDGWYPLGTLNPLDRANMAYFAGSFQLESEVDTVWNMISGAAWQALGEAGGDIEVGQKAELIVCAEPTRTAALENPLGGMTTIHEGRIVATRRVSETLTLSDDVSVSQ